MSTVLPYVQKLFGYLVSINMSFEVIKEMLGLNESYQAAGEQQWRQRKAHVAGIIRRIIRGATGKTHYSYFSLVDNPDVLQIDPVALINFWDSNQGAKLRQYQSACRAMGRKTTPRLEREYDQSLARGLREKMEKSRMMEIGTTEAAMIWDAHDSW